MLKPKVMSDPTLIASTLKNKHPEHLNDVSIKTIQLSERPLFIDNVTVKPRLTKAMKKDCKELMVSDESSFRLARGALQSVRRPNSEG